MTQSEIIQSLCDLVDEQKFMDNEEYRKQDDEYGKWSDILERYLNMKDDKKLQRIFFNFDMEQGQLRSISNDLYFREGFLCGARLAMEICGFTKKAE